MGDSKLYSAQDIEKLKQKIATYKDTLTTLKMGHSVDDYLVMKSEANGFKTKVSKLEGVMELMNEKQSVQLEEYEQQIKSFSVQMESLNQTIDELNQDLSLVKNKLIKDDSNDLIENLIAPVDVQSYVIVSDNNEERKEDLIEETTSIPSMRKSNLPPTYKELQSLVGKATTIQEVSSDVTPIVSIDSREEYPEEQHFNKQSFPYIGIHPSQIYNGLYRNVNRTSTIHLTNAAKKQAIPININENSDPSLLLTTSEPEINETVTPDPSLLLTTSEPEVNETVTPDPSLLLTTSEPEVNETVTTDPEVVHNVATIEEDKAPIEISNKMKRQQHKNKESLSLFNIFRKKH
jgi:hypothetical protein